MKKLILGVLCLLLLFTLTGIDKGPENPELEVILIPVSSGIHEGMATMVARLKIINPLDFSLKKVIVTVKEAKGLNISPATIEIDKIPANGTFITDKTVTVTYQTPSQVGDNTRQRLVWEVNYSNKEKSAKNYNGNTAADIRINEIMFFPEENDSEWVELYNGSAGQIDIAGYHICNAYGNIYRIPDTLPPVPSDAFVLIIFNGDSHSINDLSFTDDALAVLYSDKKNVFDDEGDVCALFTSIPYKVKTIRGFVTWGNIDQKGGKAQSFLKYSKAKKLWSDKKGRVYNRLPEITGPAAIVQRGGSLVLVDSGEGKYQSTAVPCRPEYITPGAKNTLPSPQLWMPRDQLDTSADNFTFSWLPVGSSHYEIQICRDMQCKEIVVHKEGLTEPNFRPAFPLERYVTYYWRVRAVRAESIGNWSEVRTFTIAFPEEAGSGFDEEGPLFEEDEPPSGAPNPLGVPSRAARKDSLLLCVDGCDQAHWDSSNAEPSAQHGHSTWYCWAAAAQMLAWYMGGDLLQDEIVATVHGNITGAPQPYPDLPYGTEPEDSLPHGSHAGASKAQDYQAVRYALQATQAQLHEQTTKPTDAELQGFIDDGRPLWYENGGHAMIIDGYRTQGGVFQARFLNTDNNGTIAWRSWANEPFRWCLVPELGLTGKIKDSRLDTDSDGDGIMDFDEDERFPTDKDIPDSEWDGVFDKADVASYTLRGISADIDGDGTRAEVDPDSDDGGVIDGWEDLDNDGEYEPGDSETDPHNPSDDAGADLDLVILIDTTTSMTDDIDAAKTAAVSIVNAIASSAGDWRVAIASFEDFPVDPYGNPSCGDFMYHDVLSFTNDQSAIVTAINTALTLRCGEDWEESHYSALMHILEKNALGGWRDNVGKAVILMSDAPPHHPEPGDTGYPAYTATDVIQASFDLDPAVIYPILIGTDQIAKARFQYLADETDGILFEAEGAEDIVAIIIEAVEAIIFKPIALAGGPYTGCLNQPLTFDGGLSYDSNGTIVLYEWDFDNDGIYDIALTDPITTHTYMTEYMGFVSLRVTDDDGLTNTDTAAVEVGDIVSPEVNIEVPGMNVAVQDGITFTMDAYDNCELEGVYLTLHEIDGVSIISTILDDVPVSYNGSTGKWEYYFNTLDVEDGNYLLQAQARDMSGNNGYSLLILFSIRNWTVIELLPATATNNPGRTMPVKFSLRINEVVDPETPFVRNEELAIRIKQDDVLLQESLFGVTSTDYRIDDRAEHYITNFKTPKKPGTFTVEVWRERANFLLGTFEFETVKK
ncbi:MAG: lamin tail domain-containing protein [Spirochaetales bacterium]|nr:lamin tail domain-containing protein [Spirochaetales bacterium]